MPTQRLPSWSKISALTTTLLPSKVGVTNGLTVPPSIVQALAQVLLPYADPQRSIATSARLTIPSCPALDLSASIGYVSETPSCQWTSAVCPPSQNPPFPSANRESAGEIGTPSDFPKHLTAPSVIWQRGASETRPASHDPQGAVRVLADLLKLLKPIHVEVRSDDTTFQVNDLTLA